MTPEILKTLLVIVGVLALFLWNRWRLEVVGLIALVAVILLDLLPAAVAVSGFANEATLTVGLMLALSAGLVRTGAVDLLGSWIGSLAADREWRLLTVLLLLVVPTSAFLNNTAVVAILLPMVMGLCRSAGIAPSRLLMPLSFGSQLGGTLTLIGTSTNLLVAGMVLEYGVERIDLFTITPPASVLAVVGIAYLLTVGRWLAPIRESDTGAYAGAENRVDGATEQREFLTEFQVEGATADAAEDGTGGESQPDTVTVDDLESYGLRVIGQVREEAEWSEPDAGKPFGPGDRVVVRGTSHDLARAREDDRLCLLAGAAARSDRTTGSERGGEEVERTDQRASRQNKIAEMLVSPASRMVGRTLDSVQENLPDGVHILALDRHGSGLEQPLHGLQLQAGDLLLVTGPRPRLQALHSSGELALLGVVELPERRTERMGLALGILAAVVLAAAFGVTTILVSALTGLVAMFLTGCLRPVEVYEDLNWGVLILLGSLLGLGTAMQETGTAAILAERLLDATSDLGPYGVLATFYLLSTVLTEVVTNNTAALVLTPVAVATAESLEVSPLPLVVAVMFAASNSFITPVGYQTNTFIYSPGGYRFHDFARVGGPLLLLLLPIATWVIPVFLPF